VRTARVRCWCSPQPSESRRSDQSATAYYGSGAAAVYLRPELDAELNSGIQQSGGSAGEIHGKVYEKAGGRKKNLVRRVLLGEVGWSSTEDDGLAQCKNALQMVLQLAHPDPAKRLMVYTDASDEHWGAVITQISPATAQRPLSEQDHEPLLMLSGTFSGSAKRWAIVEKEAYAIVETCRRADYLLHRQDGFALDTDHRNLRYIFDPHSVSSSVPKYTADKLHRWALLLMAYKYEIYDISGEDNVWADLLSRWGTSLRTVCAIRRVPLPLSPQLDDSF
jgi:hypothetical protein